MANAFRTDAKFDVQRAAMIADIAELKGCPSKSRMISIKEVNRFNRVFLLTLHFTSARHSSIDYITSVLLAHPKQQSSWRFLAIA